MSRRKKRALSRTVGYGIFGLAAAVSFLMPRMLTVPSTHARPQADERRLLGTVRDFREAHTDFGVIPTGGDGHYASNVRVTLGTDARPIFNAGGDANGPREDRIAHWTLDDGGGSIASDEMGSNPGTVTNGPTWTTGVHGGALHFDGVNDYVEVPSSPDMQINGDVTFVGWFRLDADFDASSPGTMVIMEKFLDTEHDLHIALAGVDYDRPEVPRGALVFKVEKGPTSDGYRFVWTRRTGWTAGAWHHFAATLISSDTSRNRLFIDGIDGTSPVNAGGVGFVDTDYDAPMRFGGKTIDDNGSATNAYFKGTLDDIIIFDRALLAEDFASTGAGFKVASQWQDVSTNNIAPHLARSGSLSLVNAPTLSGSAVFDSWDSTAGPYGGSNVGPSPVIETGAAMPVIHVPDDMPPGSGTVTFDSANPTIDTDLTCDNLAVRDTVTVTGDVRILCLDSADFGTGAVLLLAPGSTLTMWVGGGLDVQPHCMINANTGDPKRLTFYVYGTMGVTLGNPMSTIYANVIAPKSLMNCQPQSQFYGTFTGLGLTLQNLAGFHHDSSPGIDVCGATVDDTMGTRGVASTGGITSAATFDEWFRDVLGVNTSVAHAITLTGDGSGVWSYLDDAFHPIDGLLLGNEGETHNYHFTYHVQSTFVYEQCLDQFVEFQGGDGAWIFVGGDLAIDLGGMGAVDEQYVTLDRLGLVDGETYSLHVFYAQRGAASAPFRLRTNLDLVPLNPINVSGVFD